MAATPLPPGPEARPAPRARGAEAGSFAPRLLHWFAEHGRHDLPWQQPRSAYRVWVSEIMLQQTQVATVIPYFERFVARFADTRALADASLDEVLHLWSGLGYYARARNLHRAAQLIRDCHGGSLPADRAALEALPGIGRSTAAAILALAWDQRQPILDGNVKRVLARWAGIEGFPGEPSVAADLWAISESVTPEARCGEFVQAIMDLGATLCTRANPGCDRCPVGADCVARALGRTAELPGARPRRARPTRRVFWLVVRSPDGVLLERRPPAGVWGGLWGFPEFGSRRLAERALSADATLGGARRVSVAPVIEHAFTHFDLRITPLLVAPVSTRLDGGAERAWYNSSAPAKLGLAAPVAGLLQSLEAARAARA